jgi:hypothetical protein
MVPVGNTKINRLNPLQNGLTGLWVFNSWPPRNLITGERATSITTSRVIGSLGQAMATNNNLETAILAASYKSLWSRYAGTWSVLCEKRDSTYRAARIISNAKTAKASVLQTYTGGGTLYGTFVSDLFISATTTTSGLQHYAMTFGDGVCELYRNGNRLTQSSASPDNDITTDSPLYIGADGTADAAEVLNYFFIGAWNRRLSPADMASVHADPFSLLIPA